MRHNYASNHFAHYLPMTDWDKEAYPAMLECLYAWIDREGYDPRLFIEFEQGDAITLLCDKTQDHQINSDLIRRLEEVHQQVGQLQCMATEEIK